MRDKTIKAGYAVCRNTPEGFVEDADFCRDIAEAYASMQFYRSIGSNVWLEPRHMSFPEGC